MANKNRYDDLNTGAIAYATFVSCIVLLVTILAVRALCFAWVESEEASKLAEASYTTADNVISEQQSRLVGYDKRMVEITVPVDGQAESPDGAVEMETKAEERIQIPISRAKELIFDELGAEGGPAT